MKAIFDWGNVNWADQDMVISKVLGCSRERVRQKRIELGVGESEFKHRKNSSKLDEVLKHDTSDMTIDEIASKFSCNVAYVKKILKEAGKKWKVTDLRKGGKYLWDSADWSMTDKEVAFALGVPNVGTVTQHRRRLGIIKKRVCVAEKESVKWCQKEKV